MCVCVCVCVCVGVSVCVYDVYLLHKLSSRWHKLSALLIYFLSFLFTYFFNYFSISVYSIICII